MSRDYPLRTCLYCGDEFKPKVKNQVFDTTKCRTYYNRQHHKSPEVSLALSDTYDLIQAEDIQGAYNIEQLAKKAGNALALEVMTVYWNGIGRAKERARKEEAKKLELLAGEVAKLREEVQLLRTRKRGRPRKEQS